MPLSPKIISATGTYPMGVGSFDEAYVNGVSLTISGLTGSITVQKQQALGNIQGYTPATYNCSYINANTDAYATAGTAITADGQYLVSATAAVVLLNVTAITGSFTVVVTAVEGAVGATSSGGGGGGGSGTIVPVMVQDPTGTYTQPTGDAAGRAIFTVTQGEVADGATSSGVACVLVGGNDSGGLARTAPVNLASATPVTTATYGIQTNSVLFGNSSANTLRPLLTATGFGTSGSASGVLMVCEARASAANAGTYEPVFNNLNTSILASAARTTTQTSADQTNPNHRGIKIVLDMTVVGTGSVTLTLNGKDLNSSKYYPILAGAAVITNSTNVYTVFPGATAVANSSVSDIIPRLFQIVITANNANTATYSVSYSLVV